MNWHKKAVLIGVLAISGVAAVTMTDMGDGLTLARMQESALSLRSQVESHYIVSVFIFIGVYVVVNLWFPAAAVLTLLAGFLFGTVPAALYVDAAATFGAMVGFWLSRHLLGHWVQHRFHHQLVGFNQQLHQHGHFYLVMVRMIPMVPFSLVNFLAGLTKVRLRTLAWTTAAGSFPGILLFCYAGRQFMTINTMEDVLTPKVIVAFSLMAVFSISVIVIRIRMHHGKRIEPEEAVPETAYGHRSGGSGQL